MEVVEGFGCDDLYEAIGALTRAESILKLTRGIVIHMLEHLFAVVKGEMFSVVFANELPVESMPTRCDGLARGSSPQPFISLADQTGRMNERSELRKQRVSS